MKKIAVIMIALVLLVGGGAGAYFFLFANQAEAAEEGHGEGHAAADDHHEPPAYFTMSPFMFPMVGSRGVEQFVTLSVSFEVTDKDMVDRLEDIEPRLRDRIFRSLYRSFAEGEAYNGHTVDVDLVLDYVSIAVTETVGEGVVEDVLIQRVAQLQM